MSNPSRAVLITGCSSGIGAATASRLAKAGWTVYATARRPETLAALEADGCRTLALDVTDEASMPGRRRRGRGRRGRRRRARQQRRLQPVGRGRVGPRRSRPRPVRDQRLRPRSPCAGWCCPGCASRGGARSCNSRSMGGKLTFPGGGLYHATKHAVEALSDALRFEVKGFGVDVIVIEPGLIRLGLRRRRRARSGAASTPTDRTRSSIARSAWPRRCVREGPALQARPGRPRRSLSASRTRSTPDAPARATRSRRRRGRCSPSTRSCPTAVGTPSWAHPSRDREGSEVTAQARRLPQRWLPRVMRQAYAIAAVLAAVLTVGARAATADPFQRGDVLASIGNPSVIARFAPDGTPKGVLADSAGAGQLCFDRSSEHLIAPGTGLYDSSGTRLASAWASVNPRGDCTVDRAGNVYLAGAPSTGDRGTIRKFDLTGHPLGNYDVAATGNAYGPRRHELGPRSPIVHDLLRPRGRRGDPALRRLREHSSSPLFGGAGFPWTAARSPQRRGRRHCRPFGELLDASGTRAMNSRARAIRPAPAGDFTALDPTARPSGWAPWGPARALRHRQRASRSDDAGPPGRGIGGVAIYSPPVPPAQGPRNGGGSNTTQSTSGSSTFDATIGAQTFAMSSSVPCARRCPPRSRPRRLLASGRSLLLDTGLQVGAARPTPEVQANVTLTVARGGAHAARRRSRAWGR